MEIDLKDFVHALSYQQLLKLQFDLSHGSIGLQKIVGLRLKELEQSHQKVCATCNGPIHKHDTPYTVLFGPSDFRKKASCCAMDCFIEFVEKLKQYEGQSTTNYEDSTLHEKTSLRE
jgi:hypothetical protein